MKMIDYMVKLKNEIAVWSSPGLSLEILSGEGGEVHGLKRVKEKEWFLRNALRVVLKELETFLQKDQK